MRILLDECIDEGLRICFPGHECQTCRYAGLKGLSNGRLLTAAEEAGFQVLITVDQNLPHQQSLSAREISVMLLRSVTTNYEDLLPLVPDVLAALKILHPGEVVRIERRKLPED